MDICVKEKKHILLILLVLFYACKQPSRSDSKVMVAVAANMQFATEAIAKAFIQKTEMECELVVGSSGKLFSQIREGAPYDIFLSADSKYPENLYAITKAKNKPKIYAEGKLVLWTMVSGLSPSLSVLSSDSVQHIALANPEIAPYGKAAIEVLDSHDLYPNLKDKLVFGESISQTNQFISSKSAEIGFTALSVVLSPKMKNKGRWVALEEGTYRSISQSALILNNEHGISEAAMAFFDFLFSDGAQHILKEYGYSVPE